MGVAGVPLKRHAPPALPAVVPTSAGGPVFVGVAVRGAEFYWAWSRLLIGLSLCGKRSGRTETAVVNLKGCGPPLG